MHHRRRRHDGAEPLELVDSRGRHREIVSPASSAKTSSSRSRVSPGIPERSTKAPARAMTAATAAATRAAGSAAIDGQTLPMTLASVAT